MYIYLNVLAKMFQSEGKWLMFCVWQLPSDAVFSFTAAVSGMARDDPPLSGGGSTSGDVV